MESWQWRELFQMLLFVIPTTTIFIMSIIICTNREIKKE